MLPLCILRYVARTVGEDAAEKVRVEAGETRSTDEMAVRGAWSTEAVAVAIADAAARLTGDLEIGRRGGEEMMRYGVVRGITDLFVTEGSIPAALETVIAISSKISMLRAMTIVERGEHHIVVESRCRHDAEPRRVWCDFALGYWSGVPALFGASGYAVELECDTRGSDRCLTRVTWVPGEADVDVAAAAERSNRMFVRFEELQSTAADLAAAEDVGSVLDLVVQRAGHAVLAPRFLVAVRIDDRAELVVHHRGFRDDASARLAADAVLSGPQPPSALVVDVASSHRSYGRIAAFFPEGTDADATDRRLLSAYAGHVVAALDAAAAYEQARRDRDAAQALLDLATTLAGAVSTGEVASRLARALAAVAGSDAAAVWLWDRGASAFRLGATDDVFTAAVLPDAVPPQELGIEPEGGGEQRPAFTEAATATATVREVMLAIGARHSALVPIVARNKLLGVVMTAFVEPLDTDDQARCLRRLAAMADQAATALDNARLVEHIRHQSLHDALTGLPNRMLIEDRANHALAAARRTRDRVGMLFIDLDRFKNVNDTLGHRAGDDLIRQVAARMRVALRETDTLARIGGDEFAVLLPSVANEAEAIRVATRLVETLADPFTIEGRGLSISGSIGIAIAGAGEGDYDTLLRDADAAMYGAKERGGNTIAVHTRDDVPAFRPAAPARAIPGAAS